MEIRSRSGIRVRWNLFGRSVKCETKSSSSSSSSSMIQLGGVCFVGFFLVSCLLVLVCLVLLLSLVVAVDFVVLLLDFARSSDFLLGITGFGFEVTLSFLTFGAVVLLSFLRLREVSIGLFFEGELEVSLSGLVWFLEEMLLDLVEMLLGDFVVLVWFLVEMRLGLMVLVLFLEELRLGLMVLLWFLEEIKLSDLMLLVWFFEEELVGLISLVWFFVDWVGVVVFFFKGLSCSSFSVSNIFLLLDN